MIGAIAVIIVVLIGLFWVAYRQPRPRRWLLPRPAMKCAAAVGLAAAVDRQHRHLQSGGLMGEETLATTQSRFQHMLATGMAAEVEHELQPGLDYAIRVHALATIGGPEAIELLERQLARELSPNANEQAWYWVDVVQALRRLNSTRSLPAVLHCATSTHELPQAMMLAAEAIAFPNFAAMLHDLHCANGRRALQILAHTASGFRETQIDCAAMIRIGLGDHLAAVCEVAPLVPDPWITRVLVEAERVARRIGFWAHVLPHDVHLHAQRQAARLDAIAERRIEWLSGATSRMILRFPEADPPEQAAILECLGQLRADVSDLFPALPSRREPWWSAAVKSLAWAKSSTIGPQLARQAAALYGIRQSDEHLAAVLSSLRGHRSPEAEIVLLKASNHSNPTVRRAACGSLGWWDCYDPNAVIEALRNGRMDRDTATRRAAVAALARLGERTAINEIAEALSSEEPAIRQSAALAIADEGITLLWAELQALAESAGEPETALAACEASERLREQTLGLLG